MSYAIPLSNDHKMTAPAVIGVAKNDAERAVIGHTRWVEQLRVKGSVVWNEDTTPTLLSNLKTYLPMNNFGSTYDDGGNMVYDYTKNTWWKCHGQEPKSYYNGNLGSNLNNTQPPLSYLPRTDRRTCMTTKANAHMDNSTGRLMHLFYTPSATYKPNNDTSYLGKNYTVSMMARVNRQAQGTFHEFQYAQASHSENWRLNGSGSYDIDDAVTFCKATHIHNLYLRNKTLYLFIEAQGSTGDTHNNNYYGTILNAEIIPDNQWFHLLINVNGTKVSYHIVPNCTAGFTGKYLSIRDKSIGTYKLASGANFLDNQSGGSHRGEWIRTVGNGIRVAELRGYNTPIAPGSKSANHIINHRSQIGDLPSNNNYPELIGENFMQNEMDEESVYVKSAVKDLQNDISNLLIENYSDNMILDKFGDFDSKHGTQFYSNAETILNQELHNDNMADKEYNIQNSDGSQEIQEFKTV